jgi:Flp pilus assembly protein TadB
MIVREGGINMIGGRPDKRTQDLLWLYAAPIAAGLAVYIILDLLIGSLFLIFQVGIAIGVGVFVWRLVRSDL